MRNGWNTMGCVWADIPVAPGDALSATRVLFEVSADLTSDPPRFGIPTEHNCESLEVVVDTIAGGVAPTIEFSIWRDAAGTVPFVNDGPPAATVVLGLSAAGAEGGAAIKVDKDHHEHPTYSEVDYGGLAAKTALPIDDRKRVKLYIGLQMNAGYTANLLALGYNWRA